MKAPSFLGHWPVWASNDYSLQSPILCWKRETDKVSHDRRNITPAVKLRSWAFCSSCPLQRPGSQVLLLLAFEETGAALAVHPERRGLLPLGCIRPPGWPGQLQTEQALWEILWTWSLLPPMGEYVQQTPYVCRALTCWMHQRKRENWRVSCLCEVYGAKSGFSSNWACGISWTGTRHLF